MTKWKTSASVLAISCGVLSGCAQQAPKPALNTPVVVQASPESSRPNPVEQCRKALNSLQTVSPEQWQKHKAEFDSLVKSASQYGAVRNGVSDNTKDTVDAMYQFRTSKICSDIEKDVMDGLIEHGEKGR